MQQRHKQIHKFTLWVLDTERHTVFTTICCFSPLRTMKCTTSTPACVPFNMAYCCQFCTGTVKDVMRSPGRSPARAARPSADTVLMRQEGLCKLKGIEGQGKGKREKTKR